MKRITQILLVLILLSKAVYAQKSEVLTYEMKTRWTEEVDPEAVWQAYPRPQMKRDNYENLNGKWQYAIRKTNADQPSNWDGDILVPFAAESSLSGVKELVGEENLLWYKRIFTAPKLKRDERLLLHFGAVDWETTIFVNDKEVGAHKGGFDAFYFDVTDYLNGGEETLVVKVWDPSDKGTQARGKQVSEPFGIWYTPVTGIWQTVWLEKVPESRIELVKPTPNLDERKVNVELFTIIKDQNLKIKVTTFKEGEPLTSTTKEVEKGQQSVDLTMDIKNPRLWSPEDPFLYDMKVEVLDKRGRQIDVVESYFGMRKISLGKDAKGYTRIMLNDKPLFQFGLLDQGWWPDGLYTAPTEEAMLYDVEMTKKMGFNMIRKHVKVEPARYYYHCDKMGILVWQDMPNGNYLRDLRIQAWETEDAQRPKASADQFEAELKEMMDQFHLFPSILVWVPFNEGWGQYDTERVTKWVAEYDPSRLIDSPSGWADRGISDMVDVHLYPGPGMEVPEENRAAVLGEFGGLGHPVKEHLWWDKKNWGYLTFNDKDTFVKEFDNLINGLKGLIASGLSAAVYTQTTDVEGEVNGLITYDREVVKIAPEKLKNMIRPLYDSYWDAYDYITDSEYEHQEWKIIDDAPDSQWATIDYDDFDWSTVKGPFSTYDNFFLPNASEWSGEKLYLRKAFQVNTIPEKLYLKHYLPKSTVKIYLNGELIKTYNDKGGRKRHYTHIDISNEAKLLVQGENVLAVELSKQEDEASFDLGLYTAEPIKKNDSLNGRDSNPSGEAEGAGN